MQIKRSESLVNLSKKLIQIQHNGVRVSKDAKNPFYRSAYMTLDSVLEVLIPLCNEAGVAVTQIPTIDSLNTLVIDSESGEWLEGEVNLDIKGKGAQEIGSAISYFRRYSLCAIFDIVSDVDDDGNKAVTGNNTTLTTPLNKPTGNPAPSDKIWLNNKLEPAWKSALKLIADGTITTKEQLNSKYSFNTKLSTPKALKEELEAKLA